MTQSVASMIAAERIALPVAERERAAKATAARISNRVVVGGKLLPAVTGERFEVENPANAEVIGYAPRCGDADVARAVEAAAAALPRWSALPPRQRSTLLLETASLLEREAESIAQLSALETGNALATQTRGEARSMVDIIRFFAGLASELKGKTIPWTPGRFLFTKRVPVGVVGAIIPWNAPLMLTASKIGPALAAGNTVVLKTAEQAPLAVLRVFELLQEVLPPGVANVISGYGEEAGKPLVEHPSVRKVTFTGSSAVGVQIMHYAADKLIPVTAELGGKNPNIVLPDADLDLAIPASSRGCVCSARDNPAQPVPASTFTRTSIAKSSIDWSRRSAPAASAIRSTTPPKLVRLSPPNSWRASSATSKWPGKRRVRAF